jgi:large subunit ribosomal protein L22
MNTVQVKLRYLRHSARKFQPLTKALTGQSLASALAKTSVLPQDSARFINKLLKMAEAAAKSKELESKNVSIKEIYATIGPKIKRIRPNARGRANAYQKHLSHLVIVLTDRSNKPESKNMPKLQAADMNTADQDSADRNTADQDSADRNQATDLKDK